MEQVLSKINPNLGLLFRSTQPPIQSVEDFLIRDNLKLAEEWKLSFEEITQYKHLVANYMLFGNTTFTRWKDLPDVVPASHSEKTFFETGFGDFDSLLQGGIPKGNMMHICPYPHTYTHANTY